VGAPIIDSYRFGHLVVDGTAYDADVILLPEQVLSRWWRKEGHTLHPEDIEAVLDRLPEVLVVGQGAYGRLTILPQTRAALQRAGIELVAQPTRQACQTYNELRAQRTTAAALHLTC
jgi:hypothetical protein